MSGVICLAKIDRMFRLCLSVAQLKTKHNEQCRQRTLSQTERNTDTLTKHVRKTNLDHETHRCAAAAIGNRKRNGKDGDEQSKCKAMNQTREQKNSDTQRNRATARERPNNDMKDRNTGSQKTSKGWATTLLELWALLVCVGVCVCRVGSVLFFLPCLYFCAA